MCIFKVLIICMSLVQKANLANSGLHNGHWSSLASELYRIMHSSWKPNHCDKKSVFTCFAYKELRCLKSSCVECYYKQLKQHLPDSVHVPKSTPSRMDTCLNRPMPEWYMVK